VIQNLRSGEQHVTRLGLHSSTHRSTKEVGELVSSPDGFPEDLI